MFVNGVLILTVSNILVKAIGLLFKIPLHSYLGDVGMGYFNAAYTIYTAFFMISTAGLPVAISYMISRSRAAGNFNQVKKIMRIAFFVFLIIGSIGTLSMFFGSGMFANLTDFPDAKHCMMAIAPTLFFVCLTSAFRGYFQGHQVMWPTAVSQLLESLGKLVIGIIFAKWSISRNDPLYITAAWTILGLTIGVFFGMAFIWVTKLLYNTSKVNAEYERPDSLTMPTERTKSLLKELVVMAVPVTLSSSVMSLANLIDLMVISGRLQSIGFTKYGAAALYGNYTTLAVPLFNLIPVLVYPIGYSLVPMVSAMIVKKENTDRVINSSLKTAAIMSLPCTVGLAALSKPILKLIYGAESVLAKYQHTLETQKENLSKLLAIQNPTKDTLAAIDNAREVILETENILKDGKLYDIIKDGASSADIAAPLLTILAVSSFLVCMLAITNSILQANKKPYLPLVSMLIGAGAKIVASMLLIGNESIGVYGVPISTNICYIIVVLCNFYFCAKYANFRPSIRKIFAKPLIAAVLCGAAAIGAYALLYNAAGYSRMLAIPAIAAAAVVYFAAILVLGALEKEDFEFIPMGSKLLRVLTKLHLVK